MLIINTRVVIKMAALFYFWIIPYALAFCHLIPYIFSVQINIKPSERVIKKMCNILLLILIPLTGKRISRKGFNLNRMCDVVIQLYPVRDSISIGMVALYHFERGAGVACTEAHHLTAAKGKIHSWCYKSPAIILKFSKTKRDNSVFLLSLQVNLFSHIIA